MAEITETQRIGMMLTLSAHTQMSTAQIVGEEIRLFKDSDAYRLMLRAEKYNRNRSDVQNKVKEIANRTNTKIEHAVLKKLTDQKINYLLSRPFTVSSDRKAYSDALNGLFDDDVRSRVKRFVRGSIRMGISWMQPYFDDNGKLKLTVIPATELIPLWRDGEHSELDGFIRFYPVKLYQGIYQQEIIKAELWTPQGVEYFAGSGNALRPDPDRPGVYPHFTIDGAGYNWDIVPVIWCKYNDEELPLLYFIRELIDDLNWQTSVTSDVLRDIAKFIWVLTNYAGESLAEFVDNLKQYFAIKVEGGSGDKSGVDTIQPDPQVDGTLRFIDKQRRDIYDYGSGVDTKDPDLGSASGKAIYFRYMDLNNDCTNIGSELKVAFLRLKTFIDVYFALTKKGDFTNVKFDVTWNMDMPVDETEIINNAKTSGLDRLSQRTILKNHPWVESVDDEIAQIAEEDAKAMDDAASFGFGDLPPDSGGGIDGS